MPVEFKDYYATLGVARDASEDDIKKAFRKLARQHHPDVAKDKKGSEDMFKGINEAYEVLSDPEKRKKYDQLGADWQNPAAGMPSSHEWSGGAGGDQEFHFGGTGFSDFFEQFFGGGSRYGFSPEEGAGFGHARTGAVRPRRGSDVEGDISVTLDEAMHGTIRPISMQTVNRKTGQAETQSFQVRIPPGATDGRRIRVPSHGEPGHGGAAAGDLYLRIRHAPHPDLVAKDVDVFLDLDIAPWEAVLGAEVVVSTLDGSVKMRIPAGAENNQKLRLRGRGLPKGKTGERGDFYVNLSVRLPTDISAEERELWEKLRDTSTFRPRSATL